MANFAYPIGMRYLSILMLVVLAACQTSKQQILENSVIASRELAEAKAQQQAIIASVDQLEQANTQLKGAGTSLSDAAKIVQKGRSKGNIVPDDILKLEVNVASASTAVASARTSIRNESDTIKDAAVSTLAKVEMAQGNLMDITNDVEGVENKPSGFLSSITSFIRKFIWLAVAGFVIVLFGSLGLWPMIVQALVNFMSSGFMLFRQPKQTAKLLMEAKESPSADKIDNVITLFRNGIMNEAAWRHVKKKNRPRDVIKDKPPDAPRNKKNR